MKKIQILPLVASLCLLLAGCGEDGSSVKIWPIVLLVLGVLLLALAGLRVYSHIQYIKRQRRRGRKRIRRQLDVITIAIGAVGAVLVLIAALAGLLSGEPEEAPPTEPPKPVVGWMTDENGQRFYQLENGQRATGWQDIGRKKYYFDENGQTLSGWVDMEEGRRYFRQDGSMARGEEVIDGVTHHFTSTGEQVIMVNAWNPVPEGYEVELIELSNIYSTEGVTIGKEMEEALIQMMDACNEQSGAKCCVVSGYRDIDLQTAIFNSEIQSFMSQGLSEEEAKKQAATQVALPGTSEHQMGLAVDISDTDSWGVEADQEIFPALLWLMEHCHEYGFILRYPDGKTDVTGIIFEPWHYRYVGTELSMELKELGLTLEEYIASMD